MWTEASLLDAAHAHFGAAQPVHLLRQVEVEDRRIDGVLVVGERRIGIEAKISRADFRNETTAKRQPTERALDACVYLCPARLIEPHDLPFGWGLWWATGPASVEVAKEPMRTGGYPPSVEALATSLVRRAAATERRVRAAERVADPVAALVAVDDEVRRLEGALAQMAAAVEREKRRAQDAAEQVAAIVGDQECATCEQPITYTRVRRWRHDTRALDKACEARRAEQERRRRMAEFGAEYTSVPAPPIVPASVSMDH